MKPRSCSNNLLFAGFALVVLTGTVFPLLVEALQNKQMTVGEPYFTRLGVPIGIALLFLMAIGPVLPWRAASAQVLRDRLLIPAWAGTITLVVALIAGAHGIANVVAFALGAFALTSIGRTVVIGVRARKRTTAESLPVAAGARSVRTPGCTAVCSSTSAWSSSRSRVGHDRRLHDAARGPALPGRVGAGSRLHRHVPRSCGRTDGAEDHDQGPGEGQRRRRARARDLHVPERGRGHRHSVDPHHAVA